MIKQLTIQRLTFFSPTSESSAYLRGVIICISVFCSLLIFITISAPVFAASEGEIQTESQQLTQMAPEVLASLTEEEQKWFKKFQEGAMFFDGWKEITSDVLANIPDKKRENKKRQMQLLGVKIGKEWCKDNDVRKIDNDMLRRWGKTLRNANSGGEKKISLALTSIESEVNRLLN